MRALFTITILSALAAPVAYAVEVHGRIAAEEREGAQHITDFRSAFAIPPTAAVDEPEAPAYATNLRRTVHFDGAGEQRFAIEDRMRHYKVPGVSVAVVEGCRVVDARGFGQATPGGRPVRPETIFQAGSVSKVVASAGALKLVEDGLLLLDEDVSRHLGGWALPRTEAFDQSPVTLRQLLTHSAGLTVAGFNGYPVGTRLPTLTEILAGKPPANTGPVQIETRPGTSWSYSGGGFMVMQAMMEEESQKSFQGLMREQVLLPAGMQHSTYAPPNEVSGPADAATGTQADGTPIQGGWLQNPEHAAAGLWSSPTDLSRFAIELVRSMRGEKGALLKPGTAMEMMRRQIGDWGLGLEVSPEGVPAKFSHTGATIGYRTLWLMFPDTCQGATIMINADEGMALAYEVARGIADQYHWPDPMASEHVAYVATTQEVSNLFIGTYQLRDFPAERFQVERRPGGGLTWSRLGRGHKDLVASSRDQLLSPDSGMRLVALERAEGTGSVLTLELRFPGGINIAERAEP